MPGRHNFPLMPRESLKLSRAFRRYAPESEVGIMKKGLTEIVFILDRSGSMEGLESDTIGGFNSMIEKQKKEEGKAIISTVLFDDETEILHDRKKLKKIEPITDKDYYVRGCTALLDAVGGAIHHIGNIHKNAPKDEVPEKTIFIITTDGMENASHRYSYAHVKKMIERQKKKYGWEFIFMGANIDAVEVAGRFGVAEDRAVTYECDKVGTTLNFSVMNKLVGAVRKCKSKDGMSACLDEGAFLDEIREDYEKRHK